MKKCMILFALLIGMILFALETVPSVHVDAQAKTPVPGNPGGPGGPEKPGPKNHPTSVATPVPTKAPTPVPLVMFGPTVPPIVLGGPKPTPYPYPILPHIANQNLCQLGPCWPFGIQPGDPVELLAGGGFLAFLVVIGFVLFRGRNAQGGGGGSIQ
jgi:hypothetical protein